MKYICNYSILRFLPYPETGEFVNIGVVVLASNGEFHYQLDRTRQRVTRFFKTLDHKIYLRARDEVRAELTRLESFFTERKGEIGPSISAFKHLIHPRETMMRFSDPGSIGTNDIKKTLAELYEHYVNHSFATKEYQERVLERELGSLLAVANLKQRYKEQKLGTKLYEVRFPFVMVADEKVHQAIKPLYFGQGDSSKIYDHGDAWVSKMKRLKAIKRLAKDTLFIVEPPSDGLKLMAAFNEVVSDLEGFAGVRVISNRASNAEIVDEIKAGLPSIT
ncbi:MULTISPECIES: DUF3037 domain-containing protein [Pseudomonas syringae group]|uniref:DUF3037 domain-containing protein n=1 Tax=Pseudomonas savastanoi TaxID=29438 RepID=A0AAW3M2J3_PSESS|nr:MULTISPECIES: DUF3037 domain-containing protein [Pseudomonas syringae group]KTC60157.1 hypothetical protein AO287_17855 [Pseudomonas savastanoi]KWS95939.1 hypothetical protein AL048_19490 [Pseudomonas syringae pv. castaneae]POP79297.1 DUF3037 domain-containing protein [Pseudomonas syringae pv. syringae]